MLIVIRNGTELSQKTKLFISLFEESPSKKTICLIKNAKDQFRDKWQGNQIQLPSSLGGLFAYYLWMRIRSPKEYRDGLVARLSHRKRNHVFTMDRFLTIFTRSLYLHFGTSFRSRRLAELLGKFDEPKVFLIDEFVSLNCVDLKRVQIIGPIIYVSQDIAHNRYAYGDNIITRNLMLKLERDALPFFDLVIASSEMERLKYIEMGAKRAISYPNIYPTKNYEPCEKDRTPSLSIVLRTHWGSRAQQSLETILIALSYLKQQIKLYVIGTKPIRVPKNVVFEHNEFLQSKSDYLRILGKSWIGINVGIHKAGTNERKYDYAEAGTVVLSDTLGSRGDLLPHEYTYIDCHDLAAKVDQLLKLGRARLTDMGSENRESTLLIAEIARRRLFDIIQKTVAQTLYR